MCLILVPPHTQLRYYGHVHHGLVVAMIVQAFRSMALLKPKQSSFPSEAGQRKETFSFHDVISVDAVPGRFLVTCVNWEVSWVAWPQFPFLGRRTQDNTNRNKYCIK